MKDIEEIIAIELSHQRAPIYIREQFNMENEAISNTIDELRQQGDVFVIPTCNRLSFYASGKYISHILEFFKRFHAEEDHLRIFRGKEAVGHFFHTAAGLDSQALGEHQILGQIRKSYDKARKDQKLQPVLDELIRKAIYTGKRVRNETGIGRSSTSLAGIAWEGILQRYQDLDKLNVLVYGTGEMATLMLKLLQKGNFNNLYISSNSLERAIETASYYQAKGIENDETPYYINQCDIIIGATSAEEFVVSKEEVENNNKAQYFIDLGMPRNFDPALKTVENTELDDLDRLKEITAESIAERESEVPKAIEIIDEELGEFEAWLNTLNATPVIKSFSKQLDEIRREELEWALPKMGDLDEKQKEILEKLSHRIISKISKQPYQSIRKMAIDEEEKSLETFKEIFGLNTLKKVI